MHGKLILFCSALVFAGCNTAPPPSATLSYVKPGLVLVPADQAHYYLGDSSRARMPDAEPPHGWPVTDTRSVQTEAPVSVLQWNRYADPGRPDELMHEAHLVYRRESGPRWRLRAPAAAQALLIGPQLVDGRGEVRPLASQELNGFIAESRSNLAHQQDVLSRMAEGLKALSEQQELLAQQMIALQGKGAGETAPSSPATLHSQTSPPTRASDSDDLAAPTKPRRHHKSTTPKETVDHDR